MATNINGLIYYKLDAQSHGYPGDITKNCGLRGEEIDGNFSFLRGNDIQDISFDEQGTMYVTKYNGEVPVSFAALGYDAVYIAKQAVVFGALDIYRGGNINWSNTEPIENIIETLFALNILEAKLDEIIKEYATTFKSIHKIFNPLLFLFSKTLPT